MKLIILILNMRNRQGIQHLEIAFGWKLIQKISCPGFILFVFPIVGNSVHKL
jgi:hypothetical protein